MGVWWLSFANDHESLGACVVEVEDLEDEREEVIKAIQCTHRMGLNPGNCALDALKIDSEELGLIPRGLWYRRMSREQWDTLVGVIGLEELDEMYGDQISHNSLDDVDEEDLKDDGEWEYDGE